METLHHMVMLRSQNKITDFLMILVCFKSQLDLYLSHRKPALVNTRAMADFTLYILSPWI